MNRMSGLTIAVGVALVVGLAAQAAKADGCEDVLRYGIYRTTQIRKTDSFNSDIRRFFLSEEARSWAKKRGNSFSLGIPLPDGLPPVQLTGDMSDEEMESMWLRLISMNSEQVSVFSNLDFMQHAADPTIVDAWRDCMRKHTSKELIQMTVSDRGEYVTLRLKWNPTPDDKRMNRPAPRISGVTIEPPGAAYPVGTELLIPEPNKKVKGDFPIRDDGTTYQRYRRVEGKPLQITINTGALNHDLETEEMPAWHRAPVQRAEWIKVIFDSAVFSNIRLDRDKPHDLNFGAFVSSAGKTRKVGGGAARVNRLARRVAVQPGNKSLTVPLNELSELLIPTRPSDSRITVSVVLWTNNNFSTENEPLFQFALERRGSGSNKDWFIIELDEKGVPCCSTPLKTTAEEAESIPTEPRPGNVINVGEPVWDARINYRVGIYKL